ncbi:MAG: TIGR03560 family F420-dependent LLM class oxidoreductase [Actinobacteria bacterium]|nr:TIGR03560 family F420-dependent LLM class oxidoreductase [Actinomycetota bacterium]
MKFRVLLEPRYGASYQQILAMAQAAQEAGFDGFFRGDHYLGIDATDPSYAPTDSWATLAGLAVQTERIRLGTLVTASTFRQPGNLAVIVATVHAMSGGRAELGIGAAWYEREHQSFGIPFPPIGDRFGRLEEQLAIVTGLWGTPRGESFSFHGRHYHITNCVNFPSLAGLGRPRIILGVTGPKRGPALAARFADEFNCGLAPGAAGRIANFRRICAETGRDPATVSISAALPVCCGATAAEAKQRAEALGDAGARLLALGVTGTPADVLPRIADLAQAGADTLYFHIYDTDPGHLRLLGAEVLPQLA